jgi:opacity protein-like surface antigen
MKTVRWVLVAVVVVALGLCSQAQESKFSVYLNSGLTVPIFPTSFSNYWKSGVNIGGGLGYALSRYVDLQAYFEHNSFGFNNDFLKTKLNEAYSPFITDVSVDGGSFKIITVTANVRASFLAHGKSVRPYFIGGVGLFNMKQGETKDSYTFLGIHYEETIPSQSKTSLAASIGLGVEAMFTPMIGAFAEIRGTIGTIKLVTNFPDAKDGIVGKLPLKIGAVVHF